LLQVVKYVVSLLNVINMLNMLVILLYSIQFLHVGPFYTCVGHVSALPVYATQEERRGETAAGKVNGAHMPEPTIADDATIADIVDDLNAPEE
jgi:hypothetical protein